MYRIIKQHVISISNLFAGLNEPAVEEGAESEILIAEVGSGHDNTNANNNNCAPAYDVEAMDNLKLPEYSPCLSFHSQRSFSDYSKRTSFDTYSNRFSDALSETRSLTVPPPATNPTQTHEELANSRSCSQTSNSVTDAQSASCLSKTYPEVAILMEPTMPPIPDTRCRCNRQATATNTDYSEDESSPKFSNISKYQKRASNGVNVRTLAAKYSSGTRQDRYNSQLNDNAHSNYGYASDSN